VLTLFPVLLRKFVEAVRKYGNKQQSLLQSQAQQQQQMQQRAAFEFAFLKELWSIAETPFEKCHKNRMRNCYVE